MVQIRFPLVEFQSRLAQDHWICLQLCSAFRAKSRMKAQTRCIFEMSLISTRLLACIHSPFILTLVLQRCYLSIPFVPRTFPRLCNSPASVSLHHNIWNTVIMNSQPHSSVPQLTYTNHLWISIHPLCLRSRLPWVFSFHHSKIRVCKLQYGDWGDSHYREQWWSIYVPLSINKCLILCSLCPSAHFVYLKQRL